MSGKTRSLDFRVQQLKNLRRMVMEKSDDILNALAREMKKSRLEGKQSKAYLSVSVDIIPSA